MIANHSFAIFRSRHFQQFQIQGNEERGETANFFTSSSVPNWVMESYFVPQQMNFLWVGFSPVFSCTAYKNVNTITLQAQCSLNWERLPLAVSKCSKETILYNFEFPESCCSLFASASLTLPSHRTFHTGLKELLIPSPQSPTAVFINLHFLTHSQHPNKCLLV